GRAPDGSANIIFLPTPTPRGPNTGAAGNQAPTLGAIGDRTVYQGQVVTFTASATDPDQPQQTLAFSLDPGAPAGATINSASGVFSWPTAGVFAPSTNRVTVRVTDTGATPLSDSQTIALIVLVPPGFSVTRAGSQLTLGWPTVPGHTYRVEYA